MERKGFTLIELLAVIILLAVIALIATPIILGIIEDTKKSAFKDSAYGISQAAKNAFVVIMYAGEEPKDILYTYNDGIETSNPSGYVLNYEGEKPKNGQISLTKEGNVALALHNGKWCVTKGYNDAEITIEEKAWADCTVVGALLVDKSGANVPVLAQGMTAVVWDGSSWVTASDPNDPYKQNWYNYNSKKWANAQTADGSMWVWIPRYAYKISSGWHSKTTGFIDIQFSQGTNDNWNSGVIGALDTGAGATASQNKWTNHPGFKFGTTELTGIWIAKFKTTAVEGVANGYTADGGCPSGSDNVTTKTIKSIPNATSWRCINVGNAFEVVRKMETKAVYGWPVASGLSSNGTFTADNNGVDTHLIKNIEWGAISYLTISKYGKNTEVWVNNSTTYITGCSANDVTASGYSGCQNAYNTTTGVNASTTGNIYGIYDIVGPSHEYVTAYINNGHSNLNGQGLQIMNADAKYKDVYTKATTDDSANNYDLTINKKGDAIYEISATGTGGSSAWFGDTMNIPLTENPWFYRGGNYNYNTQAGIFCNGWSWGGLSSNFSSFRPILVIGAGL